MALTIDTFLSGKLAFTVSDLTYLFRMVRTDDIRNSDGTNNASNEANLSPQPPTNGSEFSPFIRLSGVAAYEDGINAPRLTGSNGVELPNPRVISNTVSPSDPPDLNMPQVGGWNNLLMSVGQYIDHGIDFINKGGNGTYVIPDVPGDGPVGSLTSTRATPAPGSGTSTANPTTYNNTTTPWIDQNQTYGSDPVITNLLRATLRDAAGNVVRDAAGNLVKTQYLLDGEIGPDGKAGVPTYLDILINNGVDRASLDAILNSAAVQLAHAHYTQAFANFNTQGPAAFNVITAADKAAMTDALNTIKALPGYIPDGLVPGANGQILLGDANPQSRPIPGVLPTGDVVSLLSHYIAGDLRANENVGLTAFHEVFHNSHNLIADQISAAINAANTDANPDNNITGVTNNDIFEMARIVMGAQYQRMVFDQFLIAMTGGIPNGLIGPGVFPPGALPGPIPPAEHGFLGWVPEVNASISQEFATAAFRVGHTQIYKNLGTLDALRTGVGEAFDGSAQQITVAQTDFLANVGQAAETVADSLVNLFLNPDAVNKMGGAAAILAGNAREPAQQVDTILTDAVRNLLLGAPQDLGAFNIARGREMGTVSLNEFRQAVYNFFLTTGVASSLGNGASDLSAGIFDPLSPTPDVNLILNTLRPYQNWADLGHNLRDWQASVDANGNTLLFDLLDPATWGTSVLRDSFMALYGAPVGTTPTLTATGAVTPSSSPYGAGVDRANLDNDWGLNNVDLWIGGLAEQAVFTPTAEGLVPSLMGSTFTFILQEQFDRLQDADRHYYKIDLAGTDLLGQLGAKTFSDMLRSSLGASAQYIHADTFQHFTLSDLAADVVNFTGDTDPLLTTDLIIANGLDNTLDGGLGSDDIRAGAGNDTVFGGDGTDHIYGQAGNDLLLGGDDVFIDFVFGGDGNDTLDNRVAPPVVGAVLPAGDQLYGENGNDLLFGSDFGNILDGGMGTDTVFGGALTDLIVGDSGEESVVNPYGADRLDGLAGADLISGGGNGDFIFGGIDADTINGDWAPTANAEILARAIRTNGVITDTIIPLNFEIGAVIIVDGVNPLTGVAFTEAELTEFKNYIQSLRVNPDGTVGGPNGRGAQPLMKVVPYVGPQGNDLIEGDNETTDLDGVGGVDIIFGDGGNDTIRPGALSDTVFGGRGFDTLDYTRQLSIADFHFNEDNAAAIAAGTVAAARGTTLPPDDFTIEVIATKAAAAGDAQVQVDGVVINETALLDNPDPIVVVDPVTGIVTIIPPGDTDTFYGIEAVNLRPTGTTTPTGGGINDRIRHNELLGAFNSTVNLNTNGSGNFDGLNFSGVEFVEGGLGTDTANLTSGADTISPVGPNFRVGNVTLTGFEIVNAGAGSDNLFGTAGNDTATINGASSLIFGTTTYNQIEVFTASGGVDLINGTANNDVFTQNGLNSVISSGIIFRQIEQINGGAGIDLVNGTTTNDTFTAVGTNGASSAGITYSQIERIDGGAGSDTLILGTGNDTVTGTNVFTFGGIAYSSMESVNGGGGIDTVILSAGDDTVSSTGPNAFTFAGIAYSSMESVNGGAGVDLVNGTANNDAFTAIGTNSASSAGVTYSQIEQIDGGAGVDSVAFSTANDNVSSTGPNAFTFGGIVYSSIESVNGDLGTDTLNLTSAGDTIYGSSSSFRLTNNATSAIFTSFEVVNAGAGADNLFGTQGNDTATIAGASSLIFGTTTYNSLEVFTALGGVDRINGMTTNDVFTQNGLNSVISSGIILRQIEEIDGGTGVDRVNGTTTNDTFTTNGTNGAISAGVTYSQIEQIDGGTGIDTVILSTGSDNVSYTGPNAFTFAGIAYSSIESLVGGAGNDSLTGGTSNDILTGAGNATNGVGTIDVLTGNAGADTFVLGEGGVTFYDDGLDVPGFGRTDYALVKDFAAGDRIQLVGSAANYTLISSTNVGTVANPIVGVGVYRNYDGLASLGGKDDLVGVIQGATIGLSLTNAAQFSFVA